MLYIYLITYEYLLKHAVVSNSSSVFFFFVNIYGFTLFYGLLSMKLIVQLCSKMLRGIRHSLF